MRRQLQHQLVLSPTMARPLPLAIAVQVSYADPSRAPRTLPFRGALSLSDTVQYVQRDDGRCSIYY